MSADASGPDYGAADLAEAYDGLSVPQFEHGTALLRALDLKHGDRVLDVGCGTGRLAVAALDLVGAEGRIVGIDPAEPRIAVARRHVDPRLEFRVGEGGDLSLLTDCTFDVVYLNSVLNWLGDRPRAMQEAHRVLKPGGRLGIATTVRERPNQLRILARRALKGDGDPAPTASRPRAAGGSRRVVSEAEAKSLVERAGLRLRFAEVRTFMSRFHDSRQLVDFLMASTYGRLIPGGGPEERTRLEADLSVRLARDYPQALSGDGIRLERYVLLLVAAKAA